MNKFNLVRIFSVIGGFLLNILFGVHGNEMAALITLMAIDYITGFMCGFKEKRLSSEIGFNGIIRKVAIMCLVALGHVVDIVIGAQVAQLGVIFFYIGNEGLSILENCVKLGVKTPDFIKDSLEQIMNDKRKGV